MSTTTPQADVAEAESKGWRRLTKAASELLAPAGLVLTLPWLVTWHATQQWGSTALWGLVVGITGSAIPMTIILRGVRVGRYDSHHVSRREERLVPFLICLGSLAVGWTVQILGHAPHPVIALTISMFAALAVCLAITMILRWKISIHVAVATGAVPVLVIDYGPWLALLGVLIVLVAWSRVVLSAHTLGQAIGGLIIGALAGGLLYPVLVHAMQ
ncbi:hypothetical protein F0L68_38165 [Solihabitans fulvus]|uniref:PAP2 superfamily protein n=1 Tax=Solihabitans fulvus TaxID=1892852 RepID=A0A5B2WL59_9PSEU|nr:hypothetical protein [Solihabitans fulvus]KAA2251246.1 hypothetical protein F0L68_38165 [Solihabitans fulvus]